MEIIFSPRIWPNIVSMPDIQTVDILMVNCNTINKKTCIRNKVRKAKAQRLCSVNTDIIISMNTSPKVIDSSNSKINYLLQGPSKETDRIASAKLTQQLQKEFKDVFIGRVCFDGTFL